MRDVIVAVDLETTGLDSNHDRIIEIGAVKFRGDEILDEFQSFIYPGCPIPAMITQLTGITNSDVEDAPVFSAVSRKLERFIGDAVVLGHNVHFDVDFLKQNRLDLRNPCVDTYALASVLYPSAPRYSLGALAHMLELPTDGAHRALNDVYMTVGLYQNLWQRTLELPLNTLAEIVRLGKQMHWDGALVFEAALRERSREAFTSPEPRRATFTAHDAVGFGEGVSASPLRPRHHIESLDVDEIASLIEPGGVMSQHFPAYEYRSQQVDMLKRVTQAFNSGQHLFVEAPTGVGKSLAYLLPAVHFALANNDRVVVSTNTINLQEQLISKDIPYLQEALDLPFRAAVLKGRRNYLCPRKLTVLRRRGPTSSAEMQILAKILVWLDGNPRGELSEIALRGAVETGIWNRLSAEGESCSADRCAAYMGGACPFYQARQRAEAAHILIVNHSLLLSDVAAQGRVLPEYRFLVVDEAHHLEGAVTNSMAFRTDAGAIHRQIAELGSARTGLLGELLLRTQPAIPPGYYDTLREFVEVVIGAAKAMDQHVEWLFSTLQQFLYDHANVPRNEYMQQVRILGAHRVQPAWSEVEARWGNLSHFTAAISDSMVKLAAGLSDLDGYDIEDFDDLVAGVGGMARRLTELHERLNEIVSEPDANTIYWAQFQPDGGRMSVHAAPLEVGMLVRDHLWYKKDTVIMTSATLRTDNTFDYLKQRLSAEDVDEAVISSPFDYESSTLLYIINDIAEPGNRTEYQKDVESGLLSLTRATEGRTLALFTSYAQLRQTSNAIGEALSRSGIEVYDQSEGGSRSQILESFVASDKSVLMGTRSFWEGVDVPGDDLSVLAIIRLPFNVPSDPIFAARSEQYANAFTEYAIPDTVLRFRQGFGRLIRRKTDRGVVVIFDRRVISKRYGRIFLDSLPRCTVRRGSLEELPAAAAEWLEKD